ncbi:MAG: class I SAM-dependent methyltransferase [Candidatus Obscuribacterales bacterium]|nr:class I SAM-dependent methyltransferase [Candidatus Obscuribacterales bacterium]
MTALTTAPLSTVLARLFAEIEPVDAKVREQFEAIPVQERASLIAKMKDYRTFYAQMKDAPLAVSRETANLLYMLARSIGARSIVEFGTSFGVSTLHLAAALRDNGGGKLIGTEFEPSKIEKAKRNLADGGLTDLVEIRSGDALKTLARELPQTIDLVLLDGAKHLYLPVLALIEPHLRTGALIVADNANMAPDYLKTVRSSTQGYMSLPFAEDVELSIRLG